MKRVIKFRCWSKQTQTMQPWDEMIDHGDFYRILDQSSTYPLMQFTGLTDKNGVDIYEGDVCCVAGIGNCEVVFDYCGWHFENDEQMQDFSGCEDLTTCEVIGNIHENPELIDGDT